MTQHYRYSASAFKAAMQCPGKPVMEQGLPDTSSRAADEGTEAHTLFEAAMRGHDVLGDGDMAQHVRESATVTWAIIGPGPVMLEQRVDYSDAIGCPPGEGLGTADVIALRGKILHVVDFKYGRGIEVNAAGNPQLMLYALGALAAVDVLGHEVTHVRMSIVQPRVAASPECPRECVMTVAKLRKWGAHEATQAVNARQRAASAPDVRGHLKPSPDACRWCRAAATCPALRETVTLAASGVAPCTPDDFRDPVVPTNADWIAASLHAAPLIDTWLKAVHVAGHAMMSRGEAIAGWKLVQGREGNRTWIDEASAARALLDAGAAREKVYVQSVVSPAQAEKIVADKAILKDLVSRSAGKPTIVPTSDPRQALTVVGEADFENLESGL